MEQQMDNRNKNDKFEKNVTTKSNGSDRSIRTKCEKLIYLIIDMRLIVRFVFFFFKVVYTYYSIILMIIIFPMPECIYFVQFCVFGLIY